MGEEVRESRQIFMEPTHDSKKNTFFSHEIVPEGLRDTLLLPCREEKSSLLL